MVQARPSPLCSWCYLVRFWELVTEARGHPPTPCWTCRAVATSCRSLPWDPTRLPSRLCHPPALKLCKAQQSSCLPPTRPSTPPEMSLCFVLRNRHRFGRCFSVVSMISSRSAGSRLFLFCKINSQSNLRCCSRNVYIIHRRLFIDWQLTGTTYTATIKSGNKLLDLGGLCTSAKMYDAKQKRAVLSVLCLQPRYCMPCRRFDQLSSNLSSCRRWGRFLITVAESISAENHFAPAKDVETVAVLSGIVF